MRKYRTKKLDPSRAKVLPSDNPDIIIISIPWMDGKQHPPGRKFIIAPDEETLPENHEETKASSKAGKDMPSLRRAIARAFLWRQEIESGKYAGVRAVARKHKLDESYILRQLHLTLLAPSIIEQILTSTFPYAIKLDELCKIAKIESWKEQERALSRFADAH